MRHLFDFSGNQVWVTGAAQGIGRQIAEQFQQAAALVIGFDIIRPKSPPPFDLYTLDVSDPVSVNALCHRLLTPTHPLDIFINAAGVLVNGSLPELSWQAWQHCFNVNVGGAFNFFRHLQPYFSQQRHGCIIALASNAGHVPRVDMPAYGASKAALRSLCQSVGLALATDGVRVNLVSPGSTNTQMLTGLWPDRQGEQQTITGFPERFKLGIPLQKIAQPSDIANTVLFLASPLASHITLQDIVIDGGATLGQ